MNSTPAWVRTFPPEASEGWTISFIERESRYWLEASAGLKAAQLFEQGVQRAWHWAQPSAWIRWFTDGERRYGKELWKLASVYLPSHFTSDGYPYRKVWREGLEVAIKIKGSQGQPRVEWLKIEHPWTALSAIAEVHANHLEAFNSALRRRATAYRRRQNHYAKQVEGLQRALDVQRLMHNWVRPHWSLGKQTTPAMAMGFIQRPLKLSEILVSRGLQSSLFNRTVPHCGPLAIAGLVIIISAFVTFVTILVLERILIVPILHMRDDLLAAGEAVGRDEKPNFYTASSHRKDELGEVAQAFQEMYERVWQEISDRKLAETALKEEQQKSEKLLLNILPMSIADQLKAESGAIASRFEEATILFADIVDFTGLAAHASPSDLVQMLNDIFSAFDCIADRLGLEKIKTIGDAYMVVGGLPKARDDHAEAILAMAIEMQEVTKTFQRGDGTPFQLRIGINTGPVVAGVIGIKKFSYDLWGDAVNIASRMESHGVVDRIHISASTYEHLKDHYCFEDRGCIQVKGRGQMHTYLYQGPHAEMMSAAEKNGSAYTQFGS
jgi:class 3 adenylate cyclase